MPRRTLHPGTLYHVYNRGREKQPIFFIDADYERFENNIVRFRDRYPSVQIFAYCLLPNHFHFLVSTKYPPGSEDPGVEGKTPRGAISDPGVLDPRGQEISNFFSDLQNAHAKYLSVRHKRAGRIFGGRFQSREVTDDEYLATLTQYIEWNAVKHGIVDRPEDWPYSTFDPQQVQPGSVDRFEDFDPVFEISTPGSRPWGLR